MIDRERWIYYLIRTITYPCRFLSYRTLHVLGKGLGRLAFYFMRDYRKRALSNLALARDLHLTSEKQLRSVAKKSFENLAINVLEYPRLSCESRFFAKSFPVKIPKSPMPFTNKARGLFSFAAINPTGKFCFSMARAACKGIAIGKSIKNKRLYNWVVSIREKKGGRIISPRNAVKEGLRALAQRNVSSASSAIKGCRTADIHSLFSGGEPGRLPHLPFSPAKPTLRSSSPQPTASRAAIRSAIPIRFGPIQTAPWKMK